MCQLVLFVSAWSEFWLLILLEVLLEGGSRRLAPTELIEKG